MSEGLTKDDVAVIVAQAICDRFGHMFCAEYNLDLNGNEYRSCVHCKQSIYKWEERLRPPFHPKPPEPISRVILGEGKAHFYADWTTIALMSPYEIPFALNASGRLHGVKIRLVAEVME